MLVNKPMRAGGGGGGEIIIMECMKKERLPTPCANASTLKPEAQRLCALMSGGLCEMPREMFFSLFRTGISAAALKKLQSMRKRKSANFGGLMGNRNFKGS